MFNTLPVDFKNYEVLKELGQGGFGVVYLARDTHLNRLVVLKMLHPHIAAQPNMTRRFLQEAQAMARLDHVNIVRVNRVEHDSQAPFIEMEYVEGSTLSAYRGTRVLSIPEAIPILKQIAHALDVAHQQKIIHRDVKRHIRKSLLEPHPESVSSIDFSPDGKTIVEHGLCAPIICSSFSLRLFTT